MSLPGGLAGNAERNGNGRPIDAGRDEPVDLVIDRDVESPPLADKLRKSPSRLANRHRRRILAGLGRRTSALRTTRVVGRSGGCGGVVGGPCRRACRAALTIRVVEIGSVGEEGCENFPY